MDTQNPSVHRHAQSGPAGKNHPKRRHPRSGLVHDNARHTARFTVIGNHLAQHEELSLLAIGLGVHIQSLPSGVAVDIKSLAARFTEGAVRIAAGLRELEDHGYLRRTRERVPGGRMVTRTVSCNQPGHGGRSQGGEAAEAAGAAGTAHVPEAPEGADVPAGPAAPTVPEGAVEAAVPEAPQAVGAPQAPAPAPAPKAEPTAPARPGPKPLPAVPQPSYPHPELIQAATDLLGGLRRHDTRLLLSARDTAHLAPGVAAWLERDVSPCAVRHALTVDLPPEGPRRPAALLAHRLTALLPPPPPVRARTAPERPAVRHPVRNCDGCDRGFRGPEGGRCRDCRNRSSAAA